MRQDHAIEISTRQHCTQFLDRLPQAIRDGGLSMERIPILRMGRQLLVTIQVDMHDEPALPLRNDLVERIVRDRASGVLIAISALGVVDSFIGRMISNSAAMARVLDADTEVVGMQPAVAITPVELCLPRSGAQWPICRLCSMSSRRPRQSLRTRSPDLPGFPICSPWNPGTRRNANGVIPGRTSEPATTGPIIH